MLVPLLIASQGLLPSPSPLSIGSQGLLQVGAAPVIVAPTDLPGGGAAIREDVIVRIRGNKLRITCHSPSIAVSTSFANSGCHVTSASQDVKVDCHALVEAGGTRTHLSASRVKQKISTSFEIVGCAPDDEAKIMAIVQATLEQKIIDDIVWSFDD